MATDPQIVEYEGVVLTWGHRLGGGPCGFLQPKEPFKGAEILFFDTGCLKRGAGCAWKGPPKIACLTPDSVFWCYISGSIQT